MWIIFATVLQWLPGVNLAALHLTLQTFARPAPGIFLLEAWLQMRSSLQGHLKLVAFQYVLIYFDMLNLLNMQFLQG
jgi:hypothetical protein